MVWLIRILSGDGFDRRGRPIGFGQIEYITRHGQRVMSTARVFDVTVVIERGVAYNHPMTECGSTARPESAKCAQFIAC